MDEELGLNICPRCMGCTNFKCLHNGPVMVTFKGRQLETMPPNKCNTALKFGVARKVRDKILKDIALAMKKRIEITEELLEI